MKNQKVTIFIPLYKPAYSGCEKVSLVQCCKILRKYVFSLVCPDDLDISAYEKILKEHKIDYKVERFSARHFNNIKEYNRLMLDSDFYRRFTGYEYMLTYQLDCFVFLDELEYWCEKGYDYIGAPWFEGFSLCTADSDLLDIAGNGGFSLRKIASIIKVLTPEGKSKKIIKQYIDNQKNEDIFFSMYAKGIEKDFKVAPPKVAVHFSFECLPEKLYQMTGRKLPFGCHAWERYSLEFWEQFIDLSSVDFKLEFQLVMAKLNLAMGNLDKLQDELIRVYSSREWKMASKIKKIVKFFIPKSI